MSAARGPLLKAQRRVRSDADKARRDEQFEIEEFVLLSSKFLRVQVGRKKLLSKYLGPLCEIEKVLAHHETKTGRRS